MNIKWVKVCDEHGKIHTFDNDLDGFKLEVLEPEGGGLIVRHYRARQAHPEVKHQFKFRGVSWHQVMTDL